MSDAAKNQEPSMEEILASIRRIIAEDEAGRTRTGPQSTQRAAADLPSRTPHPASPEPRSFAQPASFAQPVAAPPSNGGEMVLDLTNMVAADGSVVAIAPSHSRPVHAAPPPIAAYTPSASEHQTVAYGGFSRRPPPPGPGAEPRHTGFAQPAAAMAPPVADTPSRRVQQPPTAAPTALAEMPPNLSEDSPSRRVFKRRHTAGTAFAELTQTAFTPPPVEPRHESRSEFGQVPAGSVTTELDMSTPPPVPPAASHAFQPSGFQPSTFEPGAFEPGAFEPGAFEPAAFEPSPFNPPAASLDFRAEPARHATQDHYMPAFEPAPAETAPPAMPPVTDPPVAVPQAPSLSEDQVRAIVAAEAEPMIRTWLENNLGKMIEERLVSAVQERVAEALAKLPDVVDQRIHQNVETNLGPYIEDRVGAHVDARLAAAVEDKINAALEAKVGSAVLDERIGAALEAKAGDAVLEEKIAAALEAKAGNAVLDEKIATALEPKAGSAVLDEKIAAALEQKLDAAAIEEKISASVKQEVAAAVNQRIADAVSQQVTSTVTQQLHAQRENVSRVVDDRVKSEIRGLFQRLAGNN